MKPLVPENIKHDVSVDVNFNLNIPHPERISSSISNLIWTFCIASIVRSRLKK